MNGGMNFKFWLASSQEKILHNSEKSCEFRYASILRGEPFSFQAVFRGTYEGCVPVSITAECPGLEISAYKVGFVPVVDSANHYNETGYESGSNGLFPDMLLKRPAKPVIDDHSGMLSERETVNTLNATPHCTQSVWFTINEKGEDVNHGIYEINVKAISLVNKELLGEETFTLEVIDAVLPENKVYYTNWLHCDCLADMYGVEVFSEEFYRIFRSFIKNAALHGMNTLLLPAFTPPLDTPAGCERKSVQLVDIIEDSGEYKFDFSRLKKYMMTAEECGIKYFEHCHLFTQWGANHAPNIYAYRDGGYTRIFGWDTEAVGDDYRKFLNSYIPAFLNFARAEGFSGRMVFHISDEPELKDESSYLKAVETVGGLLDGHCVADAVSEFRFYENGCIKTPIVSIAKADDFAGKCPSFWLYYTGGTYLRNCSNRLITNTAPRTRILGLQMYVYDASGFLHWGYNYYYDKLSKGLFDPASNPCGYKLLPGASYLAYPSHRGEAIASIREKLMYEAFCDLRALRLLESNIGRSKVIDICREYFKRPVSNKLIPESAGEMLGFREVINSSIKQIL